MKTKIYVVENGDAGSVHLVRAKTSLGAIAHVVRNHLDAHLATQDDLIKLTADGVKVEEAK